MKTCSIRTTANASPWARGVVYNTRAQAALSAATPQAEALYEIFSDLMDLPQVHDYLGRMLTAVDVRYELPYAPGSEHELLGGHVPDFVVDDTTLYSLMHDGGAVLVHTPAAAWVTEAAGAWADRVQLVAALVLGRRDVTAALVRPDGVLAWVATPAERPDRASLEIALQTWFGAARAR